MEAACRVGRLKTCGLEDLGVAVAVAAGESFHHPVDLLSFSWQTEAPQELPARRQVSLQLALALSPVKSWLLFVLLRHVMEKCTLLTGVS